MKIVNKISLVSLKILEISHWIGSISMIVLFVLSLSGFGGMQNIAQLSGLESKSLITYGFEVSVINNYGVLDFKAAAMFAFGAIFILSLMAMIFRNTYLIMKKSENTTPFQKDNIRMVREVGIFSIAIPIIALIMSCVIRIIAGADSIETSVRFDSLFIGIAAFALTNVFSYGMEIQNDVDGLL